MSTIYSARSGASLIAGAALLALLTGCANMSGVGGSSSYGCKAPEGVKCDSVSGTYYNALHNNLPSQRRSTAPTAPEGATESGVSMRPVVHSPAATTGADATGFSPSPLRSQPRILRLWIKPWEDAERDLNGESLIFVQVDNGQWLVDRAQRQAREPYAPVKAPKRPIAAAPPAAEPAPTASSLTGGSDPASLAQALRARGTAPAN